MFKRIFKYIFGFSILCLIQFICNLFLKFTNLTFPVPILGIITLFILLQFKIIKKEWIKDICELILKYMPLLFIPLSVGIITYFSIIEENLIPILVNVILTALFTLLVSAIFIENAIKYKRLQNIRKMKND